MKKRSLEIKTGFILVLLAFSMMMPIAFADDVETPETEEPEIETPEVETTEESGPNNGLHKGQNTENKLRAAYNGLNKGNGAEHLYLYEKDPETWEIVDGGSWGKLTFLPNRDRFVFNAHHLEPSVLYDLINYAPDLWPGEDSFSLASGTVNGDGNMHMRGTWDAEYSGKFWLVLSGDFSESGMIGWNPTDYLFEYDLITPHVPV